MQHPEVKAFLHAPSGTFSYVVWDPATLSAAIFDSVLDYDDASGRTAHHSSDEIVSFVRDHGLCTSFIIDTHVHADHLSAMQRIQRQLGVKCQDVVSIEIESGDGYSATDTLVRAMPVVMV